MKAANNKCRGLTLAEVLVSLMIVGVAMTAGVQALGSFAAGSRTWQDRSAAMQLAAQLMAEINALPFADPSGGTTIGVDSGESAGNRTTYDDVDDYNGWSQSPPKDSTGTVMSQYSGFKQQVSVVFDTSLNGPTGIVFPAGSAKKITVTVLKDNRLLAKLVTIRTSHHAND